MIRCNRFFIADCIAGNALYALVLPIKIRRLMHAAAAPPKFANQENGGTNGPYRILDVWVIVKLKVAISDESGLELKREEKQRVYPFSPSILSTTGLFRSPRDPGLKVSFSNSLPTLSALLVFGAGLFCRIFLFFEPFYLFREFPNPSEKFWQARKRRAIAEPGDSF